VIVSGSAACADAMSSLEAIIGLRGRTTAP
jgi:hypothetical protein